jgi:homoserine O-acetyltransferase/O-succinyltransferase
MWLSLALFLTLLLASAQDAHAQVRIPLPDRQLFALGDTRLETGQVLPDAILAYATLGALNEARSNVVLAPSWYGSDYHGYDFLIGPGRALDPEKYFIVLTELFASGASSSPSNTRTPFDGPRFPIISIRDNIEAAYRLLTTKLQVNHLHAVVGFSMGAQQAFQWAVSHPQFVTKVVAYCGTAKTYPHGVVRLESAISALTADPDFRDGDYTAPPLRGLTAWANHWSAWVYSQEWWRRELFKPTFATVAEALNGEVERHRGRDPNNMISQARTWQQHDVSTSPRFNGDMEAALRSITADVLYMPSESDLYFPVGDARLESQWIPRVTFRPIPSVWGHRAGSGRNDADIEFLNREIRGFLE